MLSHKKLIFIKKNKLAIKSKLRNYLLILILTFSSLLFYNIYKYNLLLNNFKEYFNNNNFISANTLILSKQNLNPIKYIYYKKDISDFFSEKIHILDEQLKNNEITNQEVNNIICEIKRYDFIDCNYEDIFNLSCEGTYNMAINLYNQGKFDEAYYIFASIPSSSPQYEISLNYMNSSKDNLKSKTFLDADNLCKDYYYSKALDTLYSVKDIIGTDPEFISKTSEIENERSNFIAMQKSNNNSEDDKLASSPAVNSINPSTVNSLSLDSGSNYLIHVDLTNQKTYVYSGCINKWNLIKTLICSTGIDSKKTPEGSYTIKEKGDWFFSEKYKQGGKYWLQFDGNYLFHSIPYDKSKKNILDYTLGTPASHGCIRLSEADSKWLYDNIPSGSKVIINKG